jgi:hypothetical protein
MAYLTDEELSLLTKHKYTNGGYSKLDKLMDKWWCWLQTFIPKVFHYITL